MPDREKARKPELEITERQRIQIELDLFFNTSLDMHCIASDDGYFKRVSRSVTDILGWSEEEFLATPFIELVHPDDREATLREVERQVVAGEKVLRFDNRYRHKDGSWRVLSWRSAPQPGGFMYATARDVTELRRAEEALRRSEESLAVTLHSIGDAVLATDTGGRITWMNPVSEKLTGWRQAEAQGCPIAEVFQIINEETRRPATIPVDEALATGEVQGLANHTLLISRDGTEWPISDSAAPIRDKDGRILGVVLVFRDVTEERQAQRKIEQINESLERRVRERTRELERATQAVRESEEQMRLMIEGVRDYAIIMLDMDGRVVNWNSGAQRIKGYTAEEIMGQHFSRFFPEEITRSGFPEKLLSTAMTKGSVEDEGWRLRKDGSRFWASVVITAIRDETDVLQGFSKITHDITERKEMEDQMRRSQRLESIGTLAGGVAHDLNNALAPIMLATDLLRLEFPGKASEQLEIIDASVKHGADMVKQLLTFAKGGEGGDRQVLQTQPLITEIEKFVERAFLKNIELRVHLEKDPWPIWGDTTQLHQVLLNLCVNARDAMPEGGALTLKAENIEIQRPLANSIPKSEPGRYVVWHVKDSGTGIPPKVLNRIFEPFFTTKEPDKGTGLGLSTVIGIVQGHGGFMRVKSTPGKGTTFSVYLPASESVPGDDTTTQSQTLFHGNGETILVVDDDPNIRRIAHIVLTALNFHVLLAEDGEEALTQVEKHRDKLRAVVTDLKMPRMDGLTFVRTLRGMLPEVAIIVMSGHLQEKDKSEFETLGVNVILTKPFSQEKLIEALRMVMKREIPT